MRDGESRAMSNEQRPPFLEGLISTDLTLGIPSFFWGQGVANTKGESMQLYDDISHIAYDACPPQETMYTSTSHFAPAEPIATMH